MSISESRYGVHLIHMCGIGGIIHGEEGSLTKLLEAIPHRGPDWCGVWSENGVSLGHRLLAIRSGSEKSRQPYTKPGSPWVLTFNGQIYNTDELKADLSIDPAQDLDTAILFALIERDGWKFTERAFGMYAIGLYNTEEKVLRLYRDPSGQKPIYYTEGLQMFAFCSEIKGLLAALEVPRTTDTEALTIALGIGYIPGRKTLFKNISKVQAGEVVSISQDGAVLDRSFFTHNASTHFTGDPKSVMSELVREHLQSKQKVGINLSGGLDSSILLHEMSEAGHTIHSYTTRFEGASSLFNEDATLAKELAARYGANHTEITITPELFLQNLPKAYKAIEEPNYNISNATYLATAAIEGRHGDGNRVILSGDGGDEIFGGYPSYRESARMASLAKRFTPLLFNIVKYIRTGVWWNYADPIDRWLMGRLIQGPAHKDTIKKYLKESLPQNWHEGSADPVKNAMQLERHWWLPAENFTRSDKLFMTQTIELRSPFAYQPLRDYFDARLEGQDYFSVTENKHFLRSLYRGLLPKSITDRPNKTGWRSPVTEWWNDDYRAHFVSVFKNAPQGEIIDWDAIAQKADVARWPGKHLMLYYSLALLSAEYKLTL